MGFYLPGYGRQYARRIAHLVAEFVAMNKGMSHCLRIHGQIIE
jgi:hypothetical protein